VDAAVADAWGRLIARAPGTGRPIGVMDAFIAATVQVIGLTVITRNVSDFTPSGVDVHNPWTG